MQNWKRVQVLAGVLMFLFILGLFLVQRMSVLHGIIVVCTAAAGAIWFVAGRRLHRMEKDRLLEDMKWDMINTLNQHRHDWMNELQILFGYIQLKKQDKVLSHVKKIREKMYTESAVSRLGLASVIAYLVSFGAKKSAVVLDVNLEHDMNLANSTVRPEMFHLAIVEVLENFSASAQASHAEQHLRLQIDETDQEVILDYEYTGEYDAAELRSRLQRTLSEMQHHDAVKMISDLRDKEADVQIRIRSNK